MSYRDHHAGAAGHGPVASQNVTHSWADHTFRALAWQYGLERAVEIRAGRDPETKADLTAWRRLGRRSAA